MDMYYDCISDGYAELHRQEQMRKIRIIQAFLPKQASSLLDVGCGPSFADWGTWSVGIDISLALLGKRKVTSVQAKAEALPFRDCSFDAVVSITAIQNFDDIPAAIREMKRVGRDFFAISFLKKSAKAVQIEGLLEQEFSISHRIIDDKDIIIIARNRSHGHRPAWLNKI